MTYVRESDSWREIETDLPNERESWQNCRNGLVVSIERDHSAEHYGYSRSRAFQVVTLPSNYADDNQVIGLVGKALDEEQAAEVARRYRAAEEPVTNEEAL